MDGLNIEAVQSILANPSHAPPLPICGYCGKLFLDLDECEQHCRQCEPSAGKLYQTRAYLEVSYDVERNRFEPDVTVHISNEGGCDQQSVELADEPITASTIASQSPVESNLQPSSCDNAPRTLEQTSLNGQANQPITGVNESCTQSIARPEIDSLDSKLE